MITIDLGSIEYYDSEKEEFVYKEGGIVGFEYTLRMVYDWEGRWRKPFLKGELTDEEALDFYKRMALEPFDEEFLTEELAETLSKYIADPQTATVFINNTTGTKGQNGNKTASKGKVYTSEEIYALMYTARVPIEWEHRNLNRLITMLRIISSYNDPPKKMSKTDILKQNSELNAQRKSKMKTRG